MRKRVATHVVAGLLLGLSTGAFAQANEPGPPRVLHRMNPQMRGLGASTGATTPTSAINYHGGPVIGVPAMYLIWYGSWNQNNGSDTPAGQQIIRDFATGIGSSAYFYINRSYAGVSGSVTLAGQATDAYSQGKRLKDADIEKIVTNAITAGALPYNASGVYFVLSSSDVSELSGFCRTYCGWHTRANTSVGHIRYAFVGNPLGCLSGCAIQSTGPNGNAGVDGMLTSFAIADAEAVDSDTVLAIVSTT